MAILRSLGRPAPTPDLTKALQGASLEVMPRTLGSVADPAILLPAGTRVYVAHIDGTAPGDIVAAIRRLSGSGLNPVPHLPARSIPSEAMFADLAGAYRDAGAGSALVLGGVRRDPAGPYTCAMDLLASGHLDGFRRLDFAGHPESHPDMDPKGGFTTQFAALRAKQDACRNRQIDCHVLTQFLFDAAPLTAWLTQLRDAGIDMPVHVGVAGPTKLQTLLKFAISCGVGASIDVLKKRATDLTRLVLPYRSDDLVLAIEALRMAHPDLALGATHVYPLGGIETAAGWMRG